MVFSDAFLLHIFNLLPQFGPTRLTRLMAHFETAQAAFGATHQELAAAGIEPELAAAFTAHRSKINLDQEWEKLQAENIQLLTINDPHYPVLLKEIPKPPALLYHKGQMDQPEELCFAVVGTRMISNYGRTVIPIITEPLIGAGITIVSGLAYGVDAAAHKLAVDAQKRTIAVLGGGLDQKSLYPKNHTMLAEEIISCGGALLSEYPPGTPNLKQNFVARNRIISGLCPGTLIVECDLQSGTLITAKHALEQNRAVFAVPGPIYNETSKGPNNLIKMGAKPVTEADDILNELNITRLPQKQEAQTLFGDTPTESALLKIITFEPLSINELIQLSQLPAAEITSTLTFLEMKGKVKNLGGQQYVLSR